ncbi:hypothetical protein KPH14_009876 [Odynerus spinipes]|uniref:Small ribosomal subunit protein uS12m n=1 Tax=Odynerus spinipes TaxID=1348599 RepID=A0AAD9RVY9_9HYME|nr:hypothetical protein KPH14_009876 [Odynerus spinipes]
MNVLTKTVLSAARAFIGNSTPVNKLHVTGLYGNTSCVQGSLLSRVRTGLSNIFQGSEQVRCKSTLMQMHKRGPHKKQRKSKNPLDGKPFAKGIILKTVIKKPKKPNSANRKCVIVRLSTGKEMTAYVPGIGHNLQEHNVVLCRVGRVQDTPGVKIKCVRGKYDLPHCLQCDLGLIIRSTRTRMESNVETSANEAQTLEYRSCLPCLKIENDSLDQNSQPLDFRSFQLCPKTKNEAPLESPILDLSCKKTSVLPTSNDNGATVFESRSNSPASTEHVGRHQGSDQVNEVNERKSPFEGRSFMVTPPSESDSPKKIKFKPIYQRPPGTTTITNGVGTFSILPMNIPIPIVPTVLPTLLTTNSDVTKQIIGAQIQTSTATSTTHSKEAPVNILPDVARKTPRPFKAYPKDPLSLTMGTPELIYNQNSNEAYSEFRKRMLESVRRTNEGSTNTKMRRASKSPGLPTSTVDEKDAAYWERRKKNNEAAKRSRDARRAKEDEIAIRAAFLEQENMKLKYELVALRNETAKLRCMVYLHSKIVTCYNKVISAYLIQISPYHVWNA